jgi:hypothetical protein
MVLEKEILTLPPNMMCIVYIWEAACSLTWIAHSRGSSEEIVETQLKNVNTNL